MKLLLHICCAPCALYPLKILRAADVNVTGFFFRNNIHPYTECLKRQETLEAYSSKVSLDVIYQQEYDLEGFLRKMVFREAERCAICYHDRLTAAAGTAQKLGFDFFSTTLLYSKFQKHELIKSIGDAVGKSTGIPFYYHDFRVGWEEGVEESRHLQLYRQQYCGCIYSEKERFYGNAGKRIKPGRGR